jgi:hypothetical protein
MGGSVNGAEVCVMWDSGVARRSSFAYMAALGDQPLRRVKPDQFITGAGKPGVERILLALEEPGPNESSPRCSLDGQQFRASRLPRDRHTPN